MTVDALSRRDRGRVKENEKNVLNHSLKFACFPVEEKGHVDVFLPCLPAFVFVCCRTDALRRQFASGRTVITPLRTGATSERAALETDPGPIMKCAAENLRGHFSLQ